jgi:hypothetical protein
VTKRIRRRGEHGISRKAITQGMPDASAEPVGSCAHPLSIAHETAGAACTRHSLRPLFFEGEPIKTRAHPAARLRRYVLYEAQREWGERPPFPDTGIFRHGPDQKETAPDGYTPLAAAMGSHVAAPVLTLNVKYDPVADFVPIGITAQTRLHSTVLCGPKSHAGRPFSPRSERRNNAHLAIPHIAAFMRAICCRLDPI